MLHKMLCPINRQTNRRQTSDKSIV